MMLETITIEDCDRLGFNVIPIIAWNIVDVDIVGKQRTTKAIPILIVDECKASDYSDEYKLIKVIEAKNSYLLYKPSKNKEEDRKFFLINGNIFDSDSQYYPLNDFVMITRYD